MGERELKLQHHVSVPMSQLRDSPSSCITPWFSCPEFTAKRLLVRCYLTDLMMFQMAKPFINLRIQFVGGDVLSLLHKVTDKLDSYSEFKIPCARGHVEVQFSAPDIVAVRTARACFISNDYLCTPQTIDIPLPSTLTTKAAMSKTPAEGVHLVLTILITLLMPEEPISLPACPAQLSASDTLQTMLSRQLHPDVELQLQDGVLPAHRAVLAACSPVFEAMFQHDMMESQLGIVDMRDVPLAAMEAALKLLYGGELSSWDPELWMQLMELAERYQLVPMKSLCEATLTAWVPAATELPSELLLRLLVLADQHSAPDLRTATLSRFATCMRDEKLDTNVRDLVRNHPDVAEEVIKFFVLK